MAKHANTGLREALERSCSRNGRRPVEPGGWLKAGPAAPGMERIEAYFAGRAYAPHRHDTYAIGYTMTGVQCFDYRGSGQRSLPGRVIVLHPDELHDGHAGTEAGFRYRMVYLEPALVAKALDGGALPFVPDAVSTHVALRRAAHAALCDLDAPLDELHADSLVLGIASALAAAAGRRGGRRTALDRAALGRARDYLRAHADRPVGRHELEAVTGLDRWTFTRQFRTLCGTSPYRYLMMRRLERARTCILSGAALAEAALAAGFADQSHMTRKFKEAYGMPPGRWARLSRQSAST